MVRVARRLHTTALLRSVAMALPRFDLNLLIALDALLREKSITRAAERLYLSQPATSAALNRLRALLGDPLLVRAGREMELTPRARALVEPVRNALLQIESALGTEPAFAPATARREFALVVTEEAVPELLPAIVRRLAAEAPGIRCHTELVSAATLARLEHGEAHLGLCLDNARIYQARAFAASLHRQALRPVRWVAAVDREHPRLRGTPTLEEFLALPQAFGVPGTHRGPAEELVRLLLGVDLNVQLTVPSLLHLPLVLRGTPFVATLPERVARHFAATLPIRTFELPFEPPPSRELLLWHERFEDDPAHRWVRGLIAELALTA
jgi:LysR family nod box-dependent transcriptional activator